MYHAEQDYKPFCHTAALSLQASIPSAQTAGSDPSFLFTLFTTTDLRVMQASTGSWELKGYRQPDFTGHSLLDWVIPADRGLLEEDRLRLLTLPDSTMLPVSKWELLRNSIHHQSEEEMVSPAEGMREYPNQNVRMLRSDQQYSLFNIRLHLGGGLGGSLYWPDTCDRLYLVVSCLFVTSSGPLQIPHPRAVSSGMTHTYGPTTPITLMPAGPSGGVPGSSQIEAGSDAPLPAMGQRCCSGPYSPYFPSHPTSQHQHAPISTPGVTVAYLRHTSTPQPYILPTYPSGQMSSTAMYTRLPSQESQTPSYAPREYQQRQQQAHDEQACYPNDTDGQWNGHLASQTSSSSSSKTPPAKNYSRSPWES